MSKVHTAGRNVAVDLNNSLYASPSIRFPRKGMRMGSELAMRLMKPPTVEEKFTPHEVYQKVRKALNDQGMRSLKFEFAVADTEGNYEMQSSGYYNEYFDTINNQQIITAIVPETATEFEGLASPEHLVLIVPDFTKQVWRSLRWILIGAGVFTLIIIAAFYVTLKTLYNQKKLSEIKSDFINNMTHEFKTPLATISLAVDALRNEKVQSNREKMQYFSEIIKEENKRMNKHVETILQAALQEKQELQLNLVKIHVHQLLTDVLDNYQLQLEEKQAKVELNLLAKHDMIDADEVHFTNVLSNLFDNAIKYSKENLLIRVSTDNSGKYLVIKLEDNGIGMSKETVKRVFEKFYRAHTGNIHNVKGFGLGMSYVKTVVDAHKGRIKADSTLGKGSCFTLEMPLTSI